MNLLCIMGPTGIGKSALALELAGWFPIEIISVDSAMVYRGMDIGTAKPTIEERARVPHHLIDLQDPLNPYSAADFCRDALQAIDRVLAQGNLPVLVGGTMLYYRALQQGLSELPQASPEIRTQLLRDAQIHGWEHMHQRLAAIDPASAARIHANDPQRLQRALEVYEATGKSLTEHCNTRSAFTHQHTWINVALWPTDRDTLKLKLATRFDAMLEAGFLSEVEVLHQRADLHADLPALRAVGYRQAWDYLDGRCTFDQMRERSIIATRQLAKRQLTWLRSWPDINVINPESPEQLEKIFCLIQTSIMGFTNKLSN